MYNKKQGEERLKVEGALGVKHLRVGGLARSEGRREDAEGTIIEEAKVADAVKEISDRETVQA